MQLHAMRHIHMMHHVARWRVQKLRGGHERLVWDLSGNVVRVVWVRRRAGIELL